MTYRVFSQDVGPSGFSAIKDVTAESPRAAVAKVKPAWKGEKMIALPYSRRDLWPNNKTGAVPCEALEFC